MLDSLTGLRFVLALWVILHHLTGGGMMLDSWAQTLPAPVRALLHGGYLAVGTFFALSGFLLAFRYSSTPWTLGSLRHYAANRFARIYPVYALSLLILAPIIVFETVPGKMGVIANYVLLLQGWTQFMPVQWNTPAWSLSCEIFFYLVFPLALLFARKPRWVTALLIAALACVLPDKLRAWGVTEDWRPFLYFADFLMGIATAQLYRLLAPRFEGWGGWLCAPAAAAMAAAVALPELLPHSLTLNTALRPLNALILLGLALGAGTASRLLTSARALELGKASYAMYILHVPLLWWFRKIPFVDFIPGLITAPIYLAAVIYICIRAFHRVEEPANRYLRDRLNGSMSPGAPPVARAQPAVTTAAAGS